MNESRLRRRDVRPKDLVFQLKLQSPDCFTLNFEQIEVSSLNVAFYRTLRNFFTSPKSLTNFFQPAYRFL